MGRPDCSTTARWLVRTLFLKFSIFCTASHTFSTTPDQGVHYRSLYPIKPPHTAYLADVANDTTRPLLVDYFQLSTPLTPLYDQWSTADAKFAKKVKLDHEADGKLRGVRVLKQDEWETLVS